MSKLLSTIETIVDPKYVQVTTNGHLDLVEEAEDCRVRIQLRKEVVKAILIEADMPNDRLHPFLTQDGGVNNLRKKTDYILFCELEDDTIFAFAIELKSGTTDGWERQVRAGLAFARFIIAFAEVYQKKSYEALHKIEYRGVLFHKPRGLRKGDPLRQKPFDYKKHENYTYRYCKKYANIKQPFRIYRIDHMLA